RDVGAADANTAASTDVDCHSVTYHSTLDSFPTRRSSDLSTGVVSVLDGSKINYESAPGHAYTITVQASDGTLTSTQDFAIAVTEDAKSTRMDCNPTTTTVADVASVGTTVGITTSSTDVNG